nr:GDP-mannose 4,6-dehydratase [Halomicroarcula sp. XH51]
MKITIGYSDQRQLIGGATVRVRVLRTYDTRTHVGRYSVLRNNNSPIQSVWTRAATRVRTPAFVEQIVNGDVPIVYDEGTQTRCFTYIDDFVEGLLRAATNEAGRNQVFNLGNTRETEIAELANLVLEIAGHSGREPKYIDTNELYGDAYEDLDRRVPDVSKADRLLDWQAETSLETGIERVIEWGKKHYT